YAWESIPHLYIESFNRFSEIIREISPATRIIFAPAGYPGALESYPGSEMVDAVSITLNSNAEKELMLYAIPDLETQFYRKLHRLRFIDHPIFILGSENMKPESFSNIWIDNAIERMHKYPDIYSKAGYHVINSNIQFKNSQFLIGVYDPQGLLKDEDPVDRKSTRLNSSHVK